jgi:multiple sugar transport system substrate-binding protein
VPGLGQERHATRLRARQFDPNAGVWTHWVLSAFGGKLVDLQGWIVIDSAQTLAALGCARELYQTFVPGTTSWLDPDNNEAFLAGRISLTANGVSVYYAAKNSDDPGLKAIAEDIRHANFPVGPVGTPTELFLISQAMVFNHTPHPNAAKAYLLVHVGVGARAVRAVAEGIAFGAFPGRDGLPTR